MLTTFAHSPKTHKKALLVQNKQKHTGWFHFASPLYTILCYKNKTFSYINFQMFCRLPVLVLYYNRWEKYMYIWQKVPDCFSFSRITATVKKNTHTHNKTKHTLISHVLCHSRSSITALIGKYVQYHNLTAIAPGILDNYLTRNRTKKRKR